jgi:hypothetical protein
MACAVRATSTGVQANCGVRRQDSAAAERRHQGRCAAAPRLSARTRRYAAARCAAVKRLQYAEAAAFSTGKPPRFVGAMAAFDTDRAPRFVAAAVERNAERQQVLVPDTARAHRILAHPVRRSKRATNG